MKTHILVAVKLKGQRGRKESFVKSGGESFASFETWPKPEVDSNGEVIRYVGWVPHD